MGKFVQVVEFVEDKEYSSQLDYDMDVLSGAVLYMREYYKNIFTGLDDVIRACNETVEKK